ncbi:hypothetical protein, partial [Xanthomonas fragariae]
DNAVWRQPTPQETVEIVSYASTLCAIGTQQARILEVWCVVQTFPRTRGAVFLQHPLIKAK